MSYKSDTTTASVLGGLSISIKLSNKHSQIIQLTLILSNTIVLTYHNVLHPRYLLHRLPRYSCRIQPALSLFGQSPRDNHAMYEDLRLAMHSSSRQLPKRQRTTSGSSIKSGLKMMFSRL